jgi:hypothetical protein
MRKLLTAGLAALTLAGGSIASTTPAMAAPHGGFNGGHNGGNFHNSGFRGSNGWHGGYGYRGGYRGGALVAGILGFGLGAAIANSYDGYGYGPGPGYYASDYNDGYATCSAPRQVWDPYAGRYVIERVPYAC